MPKSDTEDAELSKVDEKDDQTAKYLHKLAENGKKRGLPESVTAFYGKKAWEATKSEEKYTSCQKCHMPPPPSGDFVEKSTPAETCRNCGEVNKKPIGLVSEIEDNRAISRRNEQKSLKRVHNQEKKAEVEVPKPKMMPRKFPAAPSVTKGVVRPYNSPTAITLQKGKKKKIVESKEPDFLVKLFGIGANPV